MNLLSLNMRGWGDRSKRRRLATNIHSGCFDFICIQETKREVVDEREVGVLWGAKPFKFIFHPSTGLSGGLLCSWVESGWAVSSTFNGEGFLGVSISFQSSLVHVINVYAPCSIVAKRRLWNDLIMLKQSIGEGEWCVVGDFNAISSV